MSSDRASNGWNRGAGRRWPPWFRPGGLRPGQEGCIDGHLRVINAEDVTVTADRHVIDGWAYEVAVAPNGEIVIAGADGEVQRVAKP